MKFDFSPTKWKRWSLSLATIFLTLTSVSVKSTFQEVVCVNIPCAPGTMKLPNSFWSRCRCLCPSGYVGYSTDEGHGQNIDEGLCQNIDEGMCQNMDERQGQNIDKGHGQTLMKDMVKPLMKDCVKRPIDLDNIGQKRPGKKHDHRQHKHVRKQRLLLPWLPFVKRS